MSMKLESHEHGQEVKHELAVAAQMSETLLEPCQWCLLIGPHEIWNSVEELCSMAFFG